MKNSDETIYECVSGILKGRKFQYRQTEQDEWKTAEGGVEGHTFFEKLREGNLVRLEPVEEHAELQTH